jgi:hypothetical protein
VLRLLTAAITVTACVGLLVGYYALQAREYSGLDLVLGGDFPIEADEEIGFVPVRNGATVRHHPSSGLAYRVFTSDRGARVDARGERTTAPLDLMTIGCSFSWGHGIENHETYTSVLARRRSLRAANFAFASFGTVQSLQMLARNIDLRPRVVVYGVIEDHLKRNHSGCAPAFGPACLPCAWVDFDAARGPFIQPPDGDAYAFNRRFWDTFFFRRGSWPRRLAVTVEADLRRLSGETAFPTSDPEAGRQALEFLIARMRALTQQAGAHLVIVYIPYLERDGTNAPPPALARALDAIAGPGVSVLDLAPVVARYYGDPSRPLLRFERDAHPNRAAHALIAEELEKTLDRSGLLAAP